jgi:hypothetical protein
MRKIQFETRTHQGGSKKIFRFIFLASPAKFGQLYVKHIPSEILNLWHVLHSPLGRMSTTQSAPLLPGCSVTRNQFHLWTFAARTAPDTWRRPGPAPDPGPLPGGSAGRWWPAERKRWRNLRGPVIFRWRHRGGTRFSHVTEGALIFFDVTY